MTEKKVLKLTSTTIINNIIIVVHVVVILKYPRRRRLREFKRKRILIVGKDCQSTKAIDRNAPDVT